ALDSLQNALVSLQQLGEQNEDVLKDEARVLGNLGYGWKTVGQMDKALSYFNQALELFRKLGDVSNQAVTFEQIGLFDFLRGENDRFLRNYAEALALLKQPGIRE